jgi:hypothetical protein
MRWRVLALFMMPESGCTVQQYVAALRFFFFNKPLKRRYPLEDIPIPKRHRKLPEILSPDERRAVQPEDH